MVIGTDGDGSLAPGDLEGGVRKTVPTELEGIQEGGRFLESYLLEVCHYRGYS